MTGVAGPAGELLHRVWGVERHITYNAVMLALGQIFFFWNLQKTLRGPRSVAENPWGATTMEWAPVIDEEQVCHRAPCVHIDGVSVPQWIAAVE